MKGLFIPGITAKMFKEASLESVAELMTEGEIYDIDYQEPCKGLECKECASEHRQLAEWLKELKQLKEQEPILDKLRAEIMDWQTDIHDNEYDAKSHDFVFEGIHEVIDEYKTESEE